MGIISIECPKCHSKQWEIVVYSGRPRIIKLKCYVCKLTGKLEIDTKITKNMEKVKDGEEWVHPYS